MKLMLLMLMMSMLIIMIMMILLMMIMIITMVWPGPDRSGLGPVRVRSGSGRVRPGSLEFLFYVDVPKLASPARRCRESAGREKRGGQGEVWRGYELLRGGWRLETKSAQGDQDRFRRPWTDPEHAPGRLQAASK